MGNNIILNNIYEDRLNELYVTIPVIDIEYLHSIEEELFKEEIILPIYILRYVKNNNLLNDYINKFNKEFTKQRRTTFKEQVEEFKKWSEKHKEYKKLFNKKAYNELTKETKKIEKRNG